MSGEKGTRLINYDLQINRMIIHMLRNIMQYSATNGLPGAHHFYIKFSTTHPEFMITDLEGNPDIEILNRHSSEMTIVLQNSFNNLDVSKANFTVILAFNGSMRKLVIPFASLITFHDPFANFSVRLNSQEINNNDEYIDFIGDDSSLFSDEDDEDEADDLISKYLVYDYEKYKLCPNEKIAYLDNIKQRVSSK